MKFYKYIAVVLVYRNVNDLEECIDSMIEKIKNLKIIVVNAYFDNESRDEIEILSKKKQCDFINVENRGYGFGNNRGIDYAIAHYNFEFLIVSNPDVIVREFKLPSFPCDIIAPLIVAADGHIQNPAVVKRNKLSEKLTYVGFKFNNKMLLYLGIAINKVLREIAVKIVNRRKTTFQIYQPHGSFVIFSKTAIDKLHPIYDENMFLFSEEGVVSLRSIEAGLKAFYHTGIYIYHKEDRSMRLFNGSILEELKKSNIYFYEKYCRS